MLPDWVLYQTFSCEAVSGSLTGELVVLGTNLHIPGKATEATEAAQLPSAAPSVCRPRICSVCSAAWILASSTDAHSLAGVKGCLQRCITKKLWIRSSWRLWTKQPFRSSSLHETYFSLVLKVIFYPLTGRFKLKRFVWQTNWASWLTRIWPPKSNLDWSNQ